MDALLWAFLSLEQQQSPSPTTGELRRSRSRCPQTRWPGACRSAPPGPRGRARLWNEAVISRRSLPSLSGQISTWLPFHVLGDHSEGVERPHVTDGVAALVGGAAEGVGGAGAPLVVGKGGVRLQSVAETQDRLSEKQDFSSERRRQETDQSTSKPLLAATLCGMLSV